MWDFKELNQTKPQLRDNKFLIQPYPTCILDLIGKLQFSYSHTSALSPYTAFAYGQRLK